MRILLLVSNLICFVISSAKTQQQSILLMTGKIIDGTVTSEDSLYIYYDFEKKSGKIKPRKLDWERVFSYSDENMQEVVVYVMDTTIGNYFTEEEMRFYIQGEQDAWDGYKSNWTIWIGTPINAGFGYLLGASPILIAAPFVYMVVASLPKYKMTSGSISDAALLMQPAYVLGYERTARTKRLFKSLMSGLIGAGLGLTVRELTE